MTLSDHVFPPHTGGRIRDLSQEGEGILALNSPDPAWQGRVVFVPEAVPGDELEALAYTKRGKRICVTDYDLLLPSADRQEPFCPHFGACGGCQLQNLHYQATLDWKRKHIEDLFRRIAKLDLEKGRVKACLPTISPLAFRSIVRLHVNPDGQLCFFGLKPHELIPLETCPIQSPQLNELRKLISVLLQGQPTSEVAKLTSVELRQNAAVSLERADEGADAKHAPNLNTAPDLSDSKTTSDLTAVSSVSKTSSDPTADSAAPALMVTFNFHEEPIAPDWQDFFTELLDRCGESLAPASLSLWLAVGEDYVHIAGPKHLRMKENGISFDFSPRAFQQTNLWLNQVLYQEVVKAAQTLKIGLREQRDHSQLPAQSDNMQVEAALRINQEGPDQLTAEPAPLNILELYCGSGTISLHLARAFPEANITSVEIVPEAIEDAKHNAELNSLASARLNFVVGDAGQALRGKLFAEEVSQSSDQAQLHKADLDYINQTRMADSDDPNQPHKAGLIPTAPAYDLLVLDPPRQGLDPQLCQDILHADIPHIIYVSCDPATLARDLKSLKQAYKLQTVQPLDMFPWTTHVECIALLQREIS